MMPDSPFGITGGPSTSEVTLESMMKSAREISESHRRSIVSVRCGSWWFERLKSAQPEWWCVWVVGTIRSWVDVQIELDESAVPEYCELLYRDGSSELLLPDGMRITRSAVKGNVQCPPT